MLGDAPTNSIGDTLAALKAEWRPLLILAWPIVLGELGWMTMGLVDTIFVGRVSTEALAGVSLGSVLFSSVMVFGIGLLLGLDTFVSQAYGAGDRPECERWAVAGLWLAILASPVLMAANLVLAGLVGRFGVQPEVMREAVPYLQALNWSMPLLLIFAALRRYLQSMDIVRPVMLLMLTANVVNAFADWALVFGKFGFPAMGAVGAGWATLASRVYMLAGLGIYLAVKGLWPKSLAFDAARLPRLIRLGLPAAGQITVEVSLFAVAATVIGQLPAVELAAHQVALNVVNYTFMVVLGLSSAAAVRVGQAVGRGDRAGARRAGGAAIILGALFMAAAGVVFVLNRHAIGRIFTNNDAVVTRAAVLMIAGAAFQLFDGLQAVATGALRGLADTMTPMVAHFIGYWLVGLPVGYWLCNHQGWGALGIWTGFCAALMLIGLALALMWHRQSAAE